MKTEGHLDAAGGAYSATDDPDGGGCGSVTGQGQDDHDNVRSR